MTTFGVNDKNDIYLGDDGNLVVVPSSIEATLIVCENYAKAQLREMIYQVNQGVPAFDTVFDDLNTLQFSGQLERQLLRVPNVVLVDSIEVNQVGDVLQYIAVIQTIYGVGTINGQL